MIQQKEVAQEINALMLDYGAQLNATVALVHQKCSVDEFTVYRKAVGKILGSMLIEVMEPLYKQHPHLRPQELN